MSALLILLVPAGPASRSRFCSSSLGASLSSAISASSTAPGSGSGSGGGGW